MKMKKLVTLMIACLSTGLMAQVKVDEKKVDIDGSKNGFYISIPYGDVKQIESALKDELKDWKGKYSSKSFIFVDDCSLKDMGENTFDVYAKVEANSSGGGFVSIAIDLGGAYLNSSEHGAQFKAMNARLHSFAVKTAKSLIDEEVKAEKDILKAKEKELADLESEQKKKEKEIEDFKKKIADAEKAIEDIKKKQDEKKGEIKEQEGKVKQVEKKKDAIK